MGTVHKAGAGQHDQHAVLNLQKLPSRASNSLISGLHILAAKNDSSLQACSEACNNQEQRELSIG